MLPYMPSPFLDPLTFCCCCCCCRGILIGKDVSYWLGVHRPSASQPWQTVSEQTVSQSPGSWDPYAHWAWTYSARASAIGAGSMAYLCAAARASLQYDLYLGDPSSTRDMADPARYTQQVYSLDKVYGWEPSLCLSPTSHFICETPIESYACQPPAGPPPAPPRPPMPPVPPAPPTCAPPANATFFCNAASTICYSLQPLAATYADATAACRAVSARVVGFSDPADQLEAEGYFAARLTLPSSYWLGASRKASEESFRWDEGSANAEISPLPNNAALAYAHWAWTHAKASTAAGANCVTAAKDVAYDGYLGADGSVTNAANISFYATASNLRKYGWLATNCNLR